MKNIELTFWRNTGLGAAAALLLTACAPGQDAPAPVAGVDVSYYVAVGDSYTAGLSAGGLTRASQEYSYPNLLARQLRLVAPNVPFAQPLLEAGSGTGYLALAGFAPGEVPLTRRVAGTAVRRQVINSAACGGPDTVRLFTRSQSANALPQNLGLPGLLLGQIETIGLGNEASATPGAAFNPYFERLLPAVDSRTYLQAVTAAAAPATFFTFFAGLDDVMAYVRSGGKCGIATSALTTRLRTNAAKLLAVLSKNGTRPGIIAQLPELASLPILRQGLALRASLQATFRDTAGLYIEDPIFFGQSRPITGGDYVLATALPRLGRPTPVLVNGVTLTLPYGRDRRNPVRDADVLDETEEYNRIKQVVTDYNDALEVLAKTSNLPVINTSVNKDGRTLKLNDALFGPVANRIAVGGVVYTAEPLRGNFFSLDYYTLTPRGNALLANAFIAALNRAYRVNIPAVGVNSLPTSAQ